MQRRRVQAHDTRLDGETDSPSTSTLGGGRADKERGPFLPRFWLASELECMSQTTRPVLLPRTLAFLRETGDRTITGDAWATLYTLGRRAVELGPAPEYAAYEASQLGITLAAESRSSISDDLITWLRQLRTREAQQLRRQTIISSSDDGSGSECDFDGYEMPSTSDDSDAGSTS